MKILFLHRWLVMGGVERVLINYLKLLHKEPNLQIDVIIDFDTEDNAFGNQIPDNVSTTYLFDKNYYKKRTALYANRKANIFSRLKYRFLRTTEKRTRRKTLTKLINKNQYDVVINFCGYGYFEPYFEYSKISSPMIIWQHLALDVNNKEDTERQVKYLKMYPKVVTICQEMAEQIEEVGQITKDNIAVIYNPINTKNIIYQSEQAIDVKTPYLVQVARLDKIKRHDMMINIFSELVKQGIKENLYIIGGGPEYENLQQQIKTLNLENRCFLLGEKQNPFPYMKNATLFLHTSEREGFGLVLLESLILNVPVVTMACPTGPKEITNNGKYGALVEFGNEEKFIQETLDLLRSPERLAQCKKEIPTHILQFSEEKIKQDFLSLMQSIKKMRNPI